MTDTIFVILNDSIPQTNMDVFSQVEAFYDHALTRVLVVLALVIAIFGVGVPLIVNYFQRQSFEREIQAIRDEFKTLINTSEKGLRDRMKVLSDATALELKHYSEIISYQTKGLITELQASDLLRLANFQLSFRFAYFSIEAFCIGDDYKGAGRVISNFVIPMLLPKIKTSELRAVIAKLDFISAEKLIQKLLDHDPDKKIQAEINQLQIAIKQKLSEEESDKK